jgi:hypothetical protein
VRILVVSSCTGEKSVTHEKALTKEDFALGKSHVKRREKSLASSLRPAGELYSGLQHQRLMRGIGALQGHKTIEVDLWILSAGYGLVPASQKLAPYETTFAGMKKPELQSWADQLQVPRQFRELVAQPYDLGVVLLGNDYLQACSLDDQIQLGGPTLFLTGKASAARMPRIRGARALVLSNAEAKRYRCGLVGLKGELAARLFERIAADPMVVPRLADPATELLSLLDGDETPLGSRSTARSNPRVDKVISLSKNWRVKSKRARIRYFIPEWDDLVDPDYDFARDIHSGGSGDWSNEVYAHQLYPEPNYDGILISKVVAEKSKKKKERINSLGVHRFLRVPREFPIMGDCGAFGYIGEKNPPYSTAEILDYYTRLDFDYGVSIDHLCVASNESEWRYRYELTIDNAAAFIREHRKLGLDWTPVGAVQGWSPKSYADAAAKMVKMGYKYLGLGGLVRTQTPEIIRIMQAVREKVPSDVEIHLFGLARLGALPVLEKLGVSSVDSASFLRRAWMGTGQNYLTDRGEFVAAIRIPEAEKSFRAKRMVAEGRASLDQVKRMEKACFKAMLEFDAGKVSVRQACDVLEEYDQLITPDRKSTRPLLEQALEDAPWKRCKCAICQKDGIQVIIFRGNNRNRRRGFHNTWLFYQMFHDILAGKDIPVPGRKDLASLLAEFNQTSLFPESEMS